MGLTKIRISGTLAEIDAIQNFLCHAEAVMKVPKVLAVSADYLNRDGSSYRRYLDLLVEVDPEVDQHLNLEASMKIEDLPMG